MIRDIQLLLFSKLKLKLFLFGFLIAFSTLMETISIASLLPFLNVLSDPAYIDNSNILKKLYLFFEFNDRFSFLKFIGLCSFLLIIFAAIIRTLVIFVQNKKLEYVRYELSSKILNIHLNKSYEIAEQIKSSNVSQAIISEVDQVVGVIVRPIFNIISQVLLIIGISSLLLITNPITSLFAISIFISLYFLVFFLAKGQLFKIGVTREKNNQTRFYFISEAIQGLKEIKIFDAEDRIYQSFNKASKAFSKAQAKAATIAVVPNYFMEAIAFGGIIIITILTISFNPGTSDIEINNLISKLALFGFAFYRIKPASQSVYQGISHLRYGHPSLIKVLNYLEGSFNIAQNKEFLEFNKKIEFKDVDYKYPKSNTLSLSNINLSITRGEKIIVLGSSGSGKSTFLELLTGLRSPTRGQITVDGLTLDQSRFKSWASRLGYVPQDTFLLNTSLAENITMGSEIVMPNDELLKQVISIADLNSFLLSIDHEKSIEVGERGSELSGGQRQRVGVARALYKKPDLLILDEATSALDELTEAKIITALLENYPDATIIFVTHRKTLTKYFERKILIENAKVISDDRLGFK